MPQKARASRLLTSTPCLYSLSLRIPLRPPLLLSHILISALHTRTCTLKTKDDDVHAHATLTYPCSWLQGKQRRHSWPGLQTSTADHPPLARRLPLQACRVQAESGRLQGALQCPQPSPHRKPSLRLQALPPMRLQSLRPRPPPARPAPRLRLHASSATCSLWRWASWCAVGQGCAASLNGRVAPGPHAPGAPMLCLQNHLFAP